VQSTGGHVQQINYEENTSNERPAGPSHHGKMARTQTTHTQLRQSHPESIAAAPRIQFGTQRCPPPLPCTQGGGQGWGACSNDECRNQNGESMTNAQTRMTNQARMTNDERPPGGRFPRSGFGHSSLIRVSGFVIRHSHCPRLLRRRWPPPRLGRLGVQRRPPRLRPPRRHLRLRPPRGFQAHPRRARLSPL
jgi:hypothetical protein